MGLSIGDLTIGVSSSGMNEYRDNLKMSLLNETVNKINEVDSLKKIIESGWQGKSQEKFWDDFGKVRNQIRENLKAEYKDLENRLEELERFYFDQDRKMMG